MIGLKNQNSGTKFVHLSQLKRNLQNDDLPLVSQFSTMNYDEVFVKAGKSNIQLRMISVYYEQIGQ